MTETMKKLETIFPRIPCIKRRIKEIKEDRQTARADRKELYGKIKTARKEAYEKEAIKQSRRTAKINARHNFRPRKIINVPFSFVRPMQQEEKQKYLRPLDQFIERIYL